MIELEENVDLGANIKVLGIGGGGANAVNTMVESRLSGVEFIIANTDKQSLQQSDVPFKVQLGCELTKGLGAGANPEIGRRAAIESSEQITKKLKDADMVFITAGMGGGTGTGGAPVLAKIARELGALTIGVVTKPFLFEGRKRDLNAQRGIEELKKNVDTLIVIPNQKLLGIANEKTPLIDSFKKADEVLLNAVGGISSLININGLINLDFADVKTVMQNKGVALMGVGMASGDRRAVQASNQAISSPLLENVSIEGATGIIINITGGKNLSLHEVNEASLFITEAANKDAEIIFGAVIDENLKDQVKVTVVATGFGQAQDNLKPSLNRNINYDLKNTNFIDNANFENESIEDEAKSENIQDKSQEEFLVRRKRLLDKARVYKNFQQNSKDNNKPLTTNLTPDKNLEIPAFIRRQKTQIID